MFHPISRKLIPRLRSDQLSTLKRSKISWNEIKSNMIKHAVYPRKQNFKQNARGENETHIISKLRGENDTKHLNSTLTVQYKTTSQFLDRCLTIEFIFGTPTKNFFVFLITLISLKWCPLK